MSTLDEITKEKQRVSEALARVDAQREKLASQLNELEATERVLARDGPLRRARPRFSAERLGSATILERDKDFDPQRPDLCHRGLPLEGTGFAAARASRNYMTMQRCGSARSHVSEFLNITVDSPR
jgi:hypothetical protein